MQDTEQLKTSNRQHLIDDFTDESGQNTIYAMTLRRYTTLNGLFCFILLKQACGVYQFFEYIWLIRIVDNCGSHGEQRYLKIL